ncbi:hypothetical protein [Paracidovorax citrulli]|uniref:hypothetical protein n=1 Tax=Paracidovorax citrulli TaxID=80869 RepID=UPI003FA72486
MDDRKSKTGADADHKANQKNPHHTAWRKVNDNRANQGNPDHPAYRLSRNHPRQTTKK